MTSVSTRHAVYVGASGPVEATPFGFLRFIRHPATPSDVSLTEPTIIVLDRNPFIIGRNPTCSACVLTNPCVSSVHATFTKQQLYSSQSHPNGPFSVSLADMSRNACYVNGTRIGQGKTTLLSDGDCLDLVVAAKPENAIYNLRAVFSLTDPAELPDGAADPRQSQICTLVPPTELMPAAGDTPPSKKSASNSTVTSKSSNNSCQVEETDDNTDVSDDDEDDDIISPTASWRRDVVELYEVHYDRCLGRGSFAAVYCATRRSNQQLVAVKEIQLSRVMGFGNEETDVGATGRAVDERQRREEERQRREKQILKTVRHRHVVRCYDVFQTDKRFWFAMTFAKGGELYSVLKRTGPLPERVVRKIIYQCGLALQYLHASGIVHRDIKLENLLLAAPLDPTTSPNAATAAVGASSVSPGNKENKNTSRTSAKKPPHTDHLIANGNASHPDKGICDNLLGVGWEQRLRILVSDFGLSKITGGVDGTLMQTMCGTPVYVAPEVTYVAARENASGYSPAVDIYSLGVVAFALMTGRPPFPYHKNPATGEVDKNRVEYSRQVKWPATTKPLPLTHPYYQQRCGGTSGAPPSLQPQSLNPVSNDGKTFVQRLLSLRPDYRPTACELLNDKWLLPEHPTQFGAAPPTPPTAATAAVPPVLPSGHNNNNNNNNNRNNDSNRNSNTHSNRNGNGKRTRDD